MSSLPCLVWIISTSLFWSLSSLNVTCLEAVFFRIGSATFGAVVGVVWNYSHRLFANHVWHFVRNAPGKATGPKSSKSWDDLTIGPLNITFKSFGRWCVSWANITLCSLKLAVSLQSFNTSRSLRKFCVEWLLFFWAAVKGGIVCCADFLSGCFCCCTAPNFWKNCFLRGILNFFDLCSLNNRTQVGPTLSEDTLSIWKYPSTRASAASKEGVDLWARGNHRPPQGKLHKSHQFLAP